MPDLRLDKDAALAAIEKTVKDAHGRIDRHAEALRRDIVTVAESIPMMEHAGKEAEMAAIMDFTIDPGMWVPPGPTRLELLLNGSHNETQFSAPLEKDAKYRAFVFIHRVA